jgi:gas vesicle protein
MKNSTKIIAAAALGVVAGGLIGLLFAPDKGQETRKKVAKKGKDMMNKINRDFYKDNMARVKVKLESKLKDLNAKMDEFSKEETKPV